MTFDQTWPMFLATSLSLVAGAVLSFVNPWLGLGTIIGSFLTLIVAIGMWLSQADE